MKKSEPTDTDQLFGETTFLRLVREGRAWCGPHSRNGGTRGKVLTVCYSCNSLKHN